MNQRISELLGRVASRIGASIGNSRFTDSNLSDWNEPDKRASMAKETVAICEAGFYIAPAGCA